MDWSNEKVLEFLKVFQMEPCLWDPRLPSHKSRSAQSDAWRRIVQSLPFSSTVEELKKKKESLMGYYRIHQNKYKRSLKSGAGVSNVYKTSWFAYDLMNSFLKTIYESDSTINTEPLAATSDVADNNKDGTEDNEFSKHSFRENSLEPRTSTSPKLSPRGQIFKRFQSHYKTQTPVDSTEVNKQITEASNCLKATTYNKRREEYDEYDYFALMIAAKIRKICNEDEREILMNSVQNLVFQSYMQSIRKTTPVRTTVQPQNSPGVLFQNKIPVYQSFEYIDTAVKSEASSYSHTSDFEDSTYARSNSASPETYQQGIESVTVHHVPPETSALQKPRESTFRQTESQQQKL